MSTPVQASLQQLREKIVIAVQFPNTAQLNQRFRQLPGARWSQTLRCWTLPDTDLYRKRFGLPPGQAGHSSGLLPNEISRPDPYISEKKQAPATPDSRAAAASAIYSANSHILPAVQQSLILKGYSPNTRRTYLAEITVFLKLLKASPADALDEAAIKRYLVYCHEKLKLSENGLHSRMNALKFYYEQVLKRERFFWEKPRPKKQQQLPNFFNQQEISAIINCTGNLKHKVMLMLAYSCGLRVSEVVRLKPVQIDSKRMCISIQQAKGKKDRVVPLSPVLLVMLREYWQHYQPAKGGYLFCGQAAGMPYSKRSLQLVLDAAKKKAGVMKAGSIHALRHSFATHLLDKGTDITMIMKLLGHNDLKTTLRYLHVTNRDMLRIISPLDDLELK